MSDQPPDSAVFYRVVQCMLTPCQCVIRAGSGCVRMRQLRFWRMLPQPSLSSWMGSLHRSARTTRASEWPLSSLAQGRAERPAEFVLKPAVHTPADTLHACVPHTACLTGLGGSRMRRTGVLLLCCAAVHWPHGSRCRQQAASSSCLMLGGNPS